MSGEGVLIGEQLVLQPANGLVRLLHEGRALLDQATAGVTYRDSSGQRKRLYLAGHRVSFGLSQDGVSLSVADQGLELTWQVSLGEQMDFCLEVKNTGSHAVWIDELHVLDVDPERGGSLCFTSPPQSWSFYQNGWQSRTPAFARHVTDGIWVNPNTAAYRTQHEPHARHHARGVLSSEWFTIIVPGTDAGEGTRGSPDPSVLLGFISAADQLGEIRLELENTSSPSLRAVSHADGIFLPAADKLSSETLELAAGEDPLALMDTYAGRLGRTMVARVPTDEMTGWCSRRAFSGKETGSDVLGNLTHLDREQLPLDVILIGDGYETNIGDWSDVDRAKYPQGMKHVARQIAAAGHRPGIRIAPFAVSASSKLYAQHPDWTLRDARGSPVLAWQHQGTDVYALDLSLPAVHTWLQDVFRTLCEDWGFDFFEVDLVFAAALSGVRSDPRMTRAQAVRKGLETVRSAIGERFLLASGAPLGPCIGMVDAMQVSTDVHSEWYPCWQDLSAPSAANAVLNSVTRSFLHRRLWLNSPGGLLARSRGDGSSLTLNEVRTLATITGLMGGLTLAGDNLISLEPERLELLRRVLPPHGRSAVPLDLFQHERPRVLALPVETAWGSWTIVALLNWEDRSCASTLGLRRLGLPQAAYHVYDYWKQRYLGLIRDKVVTDPHRPHEAVLLLVKPASDRPQVLSSTFHVTQGAVEIRDVQLSDSKLLVEMEKPGSQFGRLLFAVPTGVRVVGASVNGSSRRPREVSTGIWQLGFSLNDKGTVELLFD